MKTAVNSTVGVLAAEALNTCMTKAEQYEQAVIQNQDPEDLHQMRVQLRRLRTAIQVFAPSLRLPPKAQEAQVAKVARQLGQLRDLDVIGMTLRDQFVPDLPDAERAYLEPVMSYLAKRQKKAHKQVKKALKGDRYHTLKAKLHKWAASPDCNATARLSIEAVLPDLMMPLVSRLWLHPGWLMGTKVTKGAFKPDPRLTNERVDAIVADQSETLHGLRKQVKRVRYQLKFVSEHYGDRLDSDLQRFSDLQDLLGSLQDSLVLEAFLSAALPDWQRQLPTLKSLLVDSRHRAWQQWQTHQAYFLDAQHRAALRQVLLTPGPDQPESPPVKPAPATKQAPATAKKPASATKQAAANTQKRSSKTSAANGSTASKSSTTEKSSRSKSTSTKRPSPSPTSDFDSDSDHNGAS